MSRLVAAGFVAFFGYYAFTLSNAPVEVENPPESIRNGYSFVYFGTHDCGYCRRFKRNEVHKFQAMARREKAQVFMRETSSLRDLRKPHVFGEFASVWHAVRSKAGRTAVPSFAVLKDGKVIAAVGPNWPQLAAKKRASMPTF